MRSRLRWYWRRLRVMGPSEFFYRVSELSGLWILKFRQRTGKLNFSANASDFRFCSSRESQLPEHAWKFDIEENEIGELLKGRRKVFAWGWQWRADGPSAWHQAPDTKKYWPRRFFSEIPYRAGNPCGDVRVAWEPSRLQHLITLALAAKRAADGAGRDEAVRQIEDQLLSWVKDNPAFIGIHYISSMECALRILSLCHALDLVRDALSRPAPVWNALVSLVRSHAFLIERRMSRHSSAGNHTIAECCGLIYAGMLFPELEEAGRWRKLGLGLLEKEAERQVLPDGGGIEQSLWYHLFVTDLLGLASRLLARKGETSAAVHHACQRARTFLRAFAASPETLPDIGDNDHGHALSPFLRISLDEKAPPSPDLLTFNDAGYSVIRTAEPTAVMVLDHGPLGMPPSYGHGHADALAVCFNVGGEAILDDTGTYAYNTDPEWRTYFRGTRAHNTVTVDGLDQARQETAFMWSQPFQSALAHRHRGADGGIRLLGRHDGYVKHAGVAHWRGVIYNHPNRWVIWDYLAGEGTHHLELNWHAAVAAVMLASRVSLKAQNAIINMSLSGGDINICQARSGPICGWRSKMYGVRQPAYTIRSTYHGKLPHEFITRLSFDADDADFSVEDDLNSLRRWFS